MTVVTRFAPSPTGFLHIGGARTALFNWLYTRRHGGVFRLRIEDTDRKRSTQEAIDAIIDGLRWLGLEWDEEIVFQFGRMERHAEVAHEMLRRGHAYRCYASPEELAEMRERQKAEGLPQRYDGRWRDRDPADAPEGVAPVIRLKAPRTGETVIRDLVQGEVRVANAELDDMVLLRADGTPTYMLSVVVDDHDMGITHVVRGDDHLNNTFRQAQVFAAMEWDLPVFGHIPLIHGPDGAKLSKRHGALGIDAYREMGFLPEAMRNYLLRLGWGHGDEEIVSTERAIELFDFAQVGRSPSRFDMAKLTNLNGHYLRQAEDARLVAEVRARLEPAIGRELTPDELDRLHRGMVGLKERAKTLVELADSARFYVERPAAFADKARDLLAKAGPDLLDRIGAAFEAVNDWSEEPLEAAARSLSEEAGVKLGAVAQPLRAALTGSNSSPGLFEVMALLGREECLARLKAARPVAVAPAH